jgi:hypothetical protein
MIRTIHQIRKIKENFSDPFFLKNVLSKKDIEHLLSIYNSAQEKNSPLVYKNTGPVTLNIDQYISDIVINSLLEKIKTVIGDFEITAGFFFKTHYPHIIHNDDTFELPDTVYKGITIPLSLERNTNSNLYPKLCFFDQFYFHGPAKFFKGEDHIDTYYNKQIYDYKDIDNISDKKFIDNQGLLTHLKPTWLEGLSLHSSIDWIPGNIIIFDSLRLHCASDFRKLGIKSKTAISIFTKK